MTRGVLVWAQALDNRSDDIFRDGKPVTDKQERRLLLDKMTRTHDDGAKLTGLGPGPDGTMIITRTAEAVLLRWDSGDQDVAGRSSPVNVWFQLPGDEMSLEWAHDIAAEVLTFLRTTGRSDVPVHRLKQSVLSACYGPGPTQGKGGRLLQALTTLFRRLVDWLTK